MAKSKIKLDHAGIRAIISGGDVADAIRAEAERIAAQVRSDPNVIRHGMPVDVIYTTTDRAKAIVTITHALGRPVDAKHSVFAKAIGSSK